MTAEVINIRDHQSRKDRERAKKALEEHLNLQAVQIANEAFPSVFGLSAGIDSVYIAPKDDPA